MRMQIDNEQGYGYSVWYVPRNYKELQQKYNISHIPHITLETNLSLRDAYHIYHNAIDNIVIEFQNKYVKFPSLYDHDPLISYGWYVDVIKMTRRKLNWTPHLTLRYAERTTKNNSTYIDKAVLSENHIPPKGSIECDIIIADTRGVCPEEWHTRHKYFNIKVSHSYTLSCGLKDKSYPLTTTGLDEYIGTCLDELEEFKHLFYNNLKEKGLVVNEKDYFVITKAIEKELKKEINKSQAMEIDNPIQTYHNVR